ncbi:MAG: hypothetical protein ACP5JR_07620, partial [Thermoplasmata archaeon]
MLLSILVSTEVKCMLWEAHSLFGNERRSLRVSGGKTRKTAKNCDLKLVQIFVLVFLVLSVFAILNWQSASAGEIKPQKRGIGHAPIHINGNSQFTSANGVTAGSGTQDDPYIIEGWNISANDGIYCIWIENTDVWFVVRNCNVWSIISYGAEIYLKNVTNGKLENNTCYGH